jgi:hypothetical protein
MWKSPRRSATTWPSDVLCSELVQVLANTRTDAGGSMSAIVEAISETEAVLACEAPIRWGRSVLISGSSWSFRARAAGCRKHAGSAGYLVLARFEDPFRWTSDAFRPEHMLDLRTLGRQDTASPVRPQQAPRVLTAGQLF